MAHKKGYDRADNNTDDSALEQKGNQTCSWFRLDPAVSQGEDNESIAGKNGQNQ